MIRHEFLRVATVATLVGVGVLWKGQGEPYVLTKKPYVLTKKPYVVTIEALKPLSIDPLSVPNAMEGNKGDFVAGWSGESG
jgi:hypothetical protein